MDKSNSKRRDVAARKTAWAAHIAGVLARNGISPNRISGWSVVFACAAGCCLVYIPGASHIQTAILLLLAVLFIVCRLLCNLFDGMVAVEGGQKTKSGEIFNDFPDRLADPVILVASGYAIADIPGGVELGWLCGLLAVLTAYVRVLAGATGAQQRFLGPMAKQHRMAMVIAALLCSMPLVTWHHRSLVLALALLLIAVGSIITVWRRVYRAVDDLENT